MSKQVAFIMLNDGSTLHNLQIVADADQLPEELAKQINTGASLSIGGTVVTSQGGSQAIEIQAQTIEVIGSAPDYPLQPKKHTLEFLREISHLRFRTNTFGAVFRVRHAISYAIHQFFYQQGFVYLHTPIITAIDAEGAGNMFGVTTLNLEQVPKTPTGQVDFKQDFFEKKTSLTVSGQLEAETAALGLAEVYTFGPTFRAENSNTTRHLAEFWMVEPEMAFYDLADNMALAERFLKYVIGFALEHCKDDLAFLQTRELQAESLHTTPLLERLEMILAHDFERVTYTEAIDILKASLPNKQQKFAYPIQTWGVDLQSEHERYLVEQHFKKPTIITDYPRAIKAFYMRQNEDGKTVAAMDILFPGIGEIIGGSQREERLDKLTVAIQAQEMNAQSLQWYVDTRIFGTVPHSGFGLGLERLVQFMSSPFPAHLAMPLAKGSVQLPFGGHLHQASPPPFIKKSAISARENICYPMFTQLITLFLAALLGGIAVLALPKLKLPTFDLLLVFVGSYLFALTVMHLLPDLLTLQSSTHFVGLYVVIGFFLQLLLGLFSQGIEHGHNHGMQQLERTNISATALFISLCIHAFLDGIILSNATINTVASASINMRLLVGIILHKCSEAFALVSVLQGILQKRRTILWYLIGFSFASPIGLFVSKYCSQILLFNPKIFVALAAVAVGNLLHISTTIFFESSPHNQRLNMSRLFAMASGVGVVILMEHYL
eukprot:gene14-21_t